MWQITRLQSTYLLEGDLGGGGLGQTSPMSWRPGNAGGAHDSLRSAATPAAKVLQRRDLTASLRNKVEHDRGLIQSSWVPR
jgi:hypothetical protein